MVSNEFLLTTLLVVLMPGTGVIYTVSNGLFGGRRSALAAALGCTAGIIPHLLASISGLSLLLHTSALAFQTIKIIGAGYLLYMAWVMWRDPNALKFENAGKEQGVWRIAVRAMLINILNPKLSLFFLAFLPLFISAEETSPTVQMFVLSGIFMGLTLCIFALYGLFAHSVRSYVINSPNIIKMLQRSFAFAFAMFGVRLAMAER